MRSILLFAGLILVVAAVEDHKHNNTKSDDVDGVDIDYGDIADDSLKGKENPAFFQKWIH